VRAGTITAKEALGMLSGFIERMPTENHSLATDGLISYERNGRRCTVAFGLQDVHEFLPCLHAGDEARFAPCSWCFRCCSCVHTECGGCAVQVLLLADAVVVNLSDIDCMIVVKPLFVCLHSAAVATCSAPSADRLTAPHAVPLRPDAQQVHAAPQRARRHADAAPAPGL
jgi:hypothetical protein